MSSRNRDRRRQNREARVVAVEESLRRTRRQRGMLAFVGLALAVLVAVVLVSRARDNGSGAAASSTTTSSSTSTSGGPTTSTTVPGSVANKPCVAAKGPFPAGAPAVPMPVGPPPKQLVKLDMQLGIGEVVKPGATVTLNYIGLVCSTGKLFDSSYTANKPFTTPLAGVIAGWQQGIPGMRVGGQRLLGIPPTLAYRSESPGTGVAPDESLWFVVQVTKTTDTKTKTTTTTTTK